MKAARWFVRTLRENSSSRDGSFRHDSSSAWWSFHHDNSSSWWSFAFPFTKLSKSLEFYASGGGEVLEVKLDGTDLDIANTHRRQIVYGSIAPFVLLQRC